MRENKAKEHVKNSPADTKVREEGGEGSASGP